jgi:hypothetical protein
VVKKYTINCTIYFLLLLLLLASCGPSHPLNYAKIELDNKKINDYYLLDVFDSSIVGVRSDLAYQIDTIPFRRINHLYLQGKTKAGEWIGGAGLWLVGTGTVIAIQKAEHFRGDGFEGIPLLLAVPVGIFIGNKITDHLNEVDLYSPVGQADLKERTEHKRN